MLTFYYESNHQADLKIIDFTGRVLKNIDIEIKNGLNQFYFEATDLTPGIYIVQLIIDKNILTKKIEII